MNMTGEPVAEDGLPPWEDSRVQIVYEMLCDANLRSPNPEEHWEGWISRNIVRALSRPVEAAPVAEGLKRCFCCLLRQSTRSKVISAKLTGTGLRSEFRDKRLMK